MTAVPGYEWCWRQAEDGDITYLHLVDQDASATVCGMDAHGMHTNDGPFALTLRTCQRCQRWYDGVVADAIDAGTD